MAPFNTNEEKIEKIECPKDDVSTKNIAKKPVGDREFDFEKKCPFKKVTVHPLVLLSVVDHFTRISKVQKVKRVVGVLLGSGGPGKTLDIANSFAVPFDEDEKGTWFVDVDYLESMFHMFYKVAAKEKIVGWYHTGPKLCKNDIAINELLMKYTPNPVLVIIQAQPSSSGLPTEAYYQCHENHNDGSLPTKTFEHVSSEIAAEEAEEVGVEHLLRDIKDQTAGTLTQRLNHQLAGLAGLEKYLGDICKYLENVNSGKLPKNDQINYMIQEALNLLPNVHNPSFIESQNVSCNDQYMCIYMGSLIRSVIALHNLIDNKISLQKAEKDIMNLHETQKVEEKKEEKSDGKVKEVKGK
uniref:26S proteasome non-ATPase regulatory subunit 7 (inferred by orthology to a human protein) n=1 Tax=Strongyloides venezuelensis TaxID=75913 RepID=A0A0K0F9F4_STRVS